MLIGPIMANDLLDAVAANDLDLISSILNQYDDPGSNELQSLNQQDPTTGNTLAHIAASHSSYDCLALLIEYDIDVSRKNWDGLTPLGVANMNGRVEAAKLIKNNYIFDTSQEEEEWYSSIEHEIRCSDDLLRLKEAKCRSKVTRRVHPSALPSRPLMFEQRMRQERHDTELRLRAISAKKIQAWWRRLRL